VIDPKGVYLRGIPGDMSAQELKALFADVGSIKGVDIRGGTKQPGTTACAFVNFNEEASAQQVGSLL
jgi:RNA recognition motif-containing protein